MAADDKVLSCRKIFCDKGESRPPRQDICQHIARWEQIVIASDQKCKECDPS